LRTGSPTPSTAYENKIERLFEPFYTTKPEGFGMGLSISQGVIKAHGGTMEASNSREGGAHLCFHAAGTRGRCVVTSPANPLQTWFALPKSSGSALRQPDALHWTNARYFSTRYDPSKIDGLVGSQNLTPSRKGRKLKYLILNDIFLAFLASLREDPAFVVSSRFLIGQGRHAGERLALKELERCAAAG